MKTSAENVPFEGILSEQYSQPAFLPPLWRIIFQEAMRGNHLLFSKSVLAEAENYSPGIPNDELIEFCVHLFAAPDLRTIKSMIAFLPRDEQKQLFHIYLQQMASIRDMNKSSMN